MSSPLTGPAGAAWIPPGPDAVPVPAGRYWDAVRVPRCLGAQVIARLGTGCGPVIADPYASRLYLLARPGAGVTWPVFPAGSCVSVLTDACWVTVPPAGRTEPPGPHWAVPYRPEQGLADPHRLRTAVLDAHRAHFGPRDR